ncbi:MAG: hypothetical protein MZV64_31655 [Ignavibacteriales bacterium]|nr:hypothetical protein [Ignavibacteriales bacterium]
MRSAPRSAESCAGCPGRGRPDETAPGGRCRGTYHETLRPHRCACDKRRGPPVGAFADLDDAHGKRG